MSAEMKTELPDGKPLFGRKLCRHNPNNQPAPWVGDGAERSDSGSTTVAGRTRGKPLWDAVNLRQMVESKIKKTPNKSMITGSCNMDLLFGLDLILLCTSFKLVGC